MLRDLGYHAMVPRGSARGKSTFHFVPGLGAGAIVPVLFCWVFFVKKTRFLPTGRLSAVNTQFSKNDFLCFLRTLKNRNPPRFSFYSTFGNRRHEVEVGEGK